MFGEGITATRPRSGAGASGADHQIRTAPVGVQNWAATSPGTPLTPTHSTLTSSSGPSTAAPSHSLTRCGSPAISRESRWMRPEAPWLGWSSGVLPLDEERQLRVGLQALDADLLPAQLVTVGTVPVARHGLAAQPPLERGDVVDRDDPAQPPAAELGAGADGLAERRLVGGGVVEDLDHLEVGAGGQRQHHVAGAEPGVDPAVDERLPEQLAEPVGGAGEAVRSCGVREMVQAHSVIVTRARGLPDSGVRVPRGHLARPVPTIAAAPPF